MRISAQPWRSRLQGGITLETCYSWLALNNLILNSFTSTLKKRNGPGLHAISHLWMLCNIACNEQKYTFNASNSYRPVSVLHHCWLPWWTKLSPEAQTQHSHSQTPISFLWRKDSYQIRELHISGPCVLSTEPWRDTTEKKIHLA